MAAPTSISVSVDSTVYCRYEGDYQTVTATIAATGGAPYVTEEVEVSLRKARRNRDAEVSSQTLSLASVTDPVELTAEFALNDIVDSDMINLVRYGKYFVHAQYVGTEASADIGAGADGTVTISASEIGILGNSYTVEVVVPGGTAPMSAALVGTALTISLAVSGGVATAANTAASIATAINSATTELSASYSGTGAGTITAAEGPTAFTGGTDTVEGESDDFWILPISVERLKKEFLFGLDLRSTELKTPRFQPRSITGITVTELSKGHPDGFGTLSYHYHVDGATTVRSLSWNGGPSISITTAGEYILPTGSAPLPLPLPGITVSTPHYIIVKVRSPVLLPSSSVAESLMIEREKMDEEGIINHIVRATHWLEQDELCVYVEPTNVVTEADPTSIQYANGSGDPTPITTDADYDFIVSPLTYFIPAGGYPGWVYVQTPFLSILRVDSLYGTIANTRVIDVDLEWIQHSREGGFLQLIPFNTEVSFDFIGLAVVNAIHGATELPNFWHFNMMVGLRDASPDIREIIAKKAAIDILTIAGLAIRPGIGSISLGRDGVSQSTSYNASQQFGMFNGAIQSYKESMQDQLKKLRARYRGATLVVV